MRQFIDAIGPSLGWFFAKLRPYDLDAYAAAVKATRDATAVELVVTDADRRASILSGASLAGTFKYVSMHLFDLTHFSLNDLEMLESICRHHQIVTAPVHPDVAPPAACQVLLKHGIPVAIENMDRKKSIGKSAEEIQSHAASSGNPRFVLDLQHAFEIAQDRGVPYKQYLNELLDMMGDRLAELHVSGEIVASGKQVVQHAQLHMATNRCDILSGLRTILLRQSRPIPIILEGDYLLSLPEGYTPRDMDERAHLLDHAQREIRREIWCVYEETMKTRSS